MLEKLHIGHFGINKTKARARQIFYWPNTSADIDNFISHCKRSEKHSYRKIKEPFATAYDT